MSILLYSTSTEGAGQQLGRALEWAAPGIEVEIYRTIEDLSDRLLKPRGDLAIGVLLAATKQELGQLLSIQDLLEDLRIILVLPDWESDTVSKGHILRPRFLTQVSSDFSDVAAVLSKMLEVSHRDRRIDENTYRTNERQFETTDNVNN